MVSVSDSYKKVRPGSKPPLLEGMYMEVVLSGRERKMLVLPRFALHNKQIFTIDHNSQLQRISLNDMQYRGDLLLLEPSDKGSIKAKDKIITSDVFPAVNGMKVNASYDQVTAKQMQQWLTPVTKQTEEKPLAVEH